jgi:TolB-like protein
MSSANLRVRLFGPPVVTGTDDLPVGSVSAEPQRLALLALLALHPKRTVSRAELANYLWPTRNAEQARQALNQALFAISKALGDDAIFPSAKEVRLGTRVSVDALEFQSALEAGRPEDAMPLYTAPLMDGFELDGAPKFQQWVAAQRARFATAARTQQPVEAAVIEVMHDLAEPEKPVPTPEVAPKENPAQKAPKKPEPPMDLGLLAEPALRARVEQTAEGPELRANRPPDPELITNAAPVAQDPVVNAAPTEPALMTNAVPSEPESVTTVAPPESREPVNVPPPQPPSAPREEVQWIVPDAPPSALEATAAAAPPPATPELQEDLAVSGAPPAPVGSTPLERAKRWRPRFPLPSARLVVTVLSLVALAALGYWARGWIGAARRGSIDAARGGIEAVRGRADALLQAKDRKRSIAVLPIEYSGRNQADAALAARVVEELGPMLTRAGLLVMPSSALTRGGPPYDLRVIADSLRVEHILQGVMRREGEKVAFRFRLLNPVDGTTRWEDTYRPKVADIPDMQEYLAGKVGAQILGGPPERN